jgi:DNA-binding transcriptional ArsR family regulator
MRLSQRADYAAHAMVEIARWYGERPVHATEIAQRQGIPEPYLEQLLLALRRAALVRSRDQPGRRRRRPGRAIRAARGRPTRCRGRRFRPFDLSDS